MKLLIHFLIKYLQSFQGCQPPLCNSLSEILKSSGFSVQTSYLQERQYLAGVPHIILFPSSASKTLWDILALHSEFQSVGNTILVRSG